MKALSTPNRLSRRRAIGLFTAAGASLKLFSSLATAADGTCIVSPTETEGPYFTEEMLNRSDIRVDPSDGSMRPGTMLKLSITVHTVTDTACGLMQGAQVDVWHCDAGGTYSDVAANNTVGKRYLRGYQVTDENGSVQFTTIYPGWYSGRTVHIHVKVRTFSGSDVVSEFTSQLYFDEAVTDEVYQQAPYVSRPNRDTRNSSDGIYSGASDDGVITQNNGEMMLLQLTKTAEGYTGAIDIGIKMNGGKPAVTEGGIADTASAQPVLTPGGWFTIKGTSLAMISRTLNSSRDVVNGLLPASMNGVSVTVNDQPAFLASVSPTQIVAQAPSNLSEGTAQVVVTTAEGTSEPYAIDVKSMFPAFFAAQNAVYAVRSDGVVIGTAVTLPGSATQATTAAGPGQGGPGGGGTPPGGAGGPGGPGGGGGNPGGTTTATAAKPGDVVTLYGSGFGSTNPPVAAGEFYQASASIDNAVLITVGGTPAVVSSSALTRAGIYEFKVTVPVLGDGTHDVLAEAAGAISPSGITLRVQS